MLAIVGTVVRMQNLTSPEAMAVELTVGTETPLSILPPDSRGPFRGPLRSAIQNFIFTILSGVSGQMKNYFPTLFPMVIHALFRTSIFRRSSLRLYFLLTSEKRNEAIGESDCAWGVLRRSCGGCNRRLASRRTPGLTQQAVGGAADADLPEGVGGADAPRQVPINLKELGDDLLACIASSA